MKKIEVGDTVVVNRDVVVRVDGTSVDKGTRGVVGYGNLDEFKTVHFETGDGVSHNIHEAFLDLEVTEMKKTYIVSVDGCDDSTAIIQELTLEEYELLNTIAEKITNASEYGCMPTMEIKEVTK